MQVILVMVKGEGVQIVRYLSIKSSKMLTDKRRAYICNNQANKSETLLTGIFNSKRLIKYRPKLEIQSF